MWAGVAAFIGCAVCCTLPLVVLLGAGSGAAATVTAFLSPGSELIVGGAVFVVALTAMMLRKRMRRGEPSPRIGVSDGN